MLGVVHGDCGRTGYAGQYANGWTYYSQGGMYHSGSTPSTGERFAVGDRIGVKIDLEGGKIVFYRNGKLSTTASGLPSSKGGELFYPIACFSAMGDSVSIVVKSSKRKGQEEEPEDVEDTTGSSVIASVGGLFGDDDDGVDLFG